jgi:hypothetical protein
MTGKNRLYRNLRESMLSYWRSMLDVQDRLRRYPPDWVKENLHRHRAASIFREPHDYSYAWSNFGELWVVKYADYYAAAPAQFCFFGVRRQSVRRLKDYEELTAQTSVQDLILLRDDVKLFSVALDAWLDNNPPGTIKPVYFKYAELHSMSATPLTGVQTSLTAPINTYLPLREYKSLKARFPSLIQDLELRNSDWSKDGVGFSNMPNALAQQLQEARQIVEKDN